MTVEEVILHARDMHPGFDDKAVPDKVLFRFLERCQDELVEDVVAVYPQALDWCVKRIDLPLLDFERGAAFPEHLYPMKGQVDYPDRLQELHLVDWYQLPAPARWPAAAIVNCRLYLGRTEAAWAQAECLNVPYIAVPEPLDDLESEFALPRIARNALVAAAAWFMSTRLPEVSSSGLEATKNEEKKRFLKTITSRRRTHRLRVQRRA